MSTQVPRGDAGPAGTAGTVEVSSTITGLPGTEANVVNIGNEVTALLEFTIPRGDPGEDGSNGSDGVSPTVNVGTTTTLPAGSQATVSNSGTETDAVFEFGIPKGDKGDPGPTGPQGPIGTGVTYKGAINATTAPEPSNPENGDYYINTADGTCNWTGVGKEITENDRLVYNSGTSSWDHYAGTGGSDFWKEDNDVLHPTNVNASVQVGGDPAGSANTGVSVYPGGYIRASRPNDTDNIFIGYKQVLATLRP